MTRPAATPLTRPIHPAAAILVSAPTARDPRATRCSIRPAPVREPPFDDEPAARHLALVGRNALTLPFGEPFDAAVQRARTESTSGPRPDLSEPLRFGRFFVQALLEVLCGRRPAIQLARHSSPRVHADLIRDQALGGRFETTGRNPVIHSVHIMEPADRVAEMTAVVQVGARFRAIAARLESRDGKWRCVHLQIA